MASKVSEKILLEKEIEKEQAFENKINKNPASSKNFITIKGARVHNLKNIDLRIPRDRFIVFTGLSGSGKSSLAFDTLYAEGHRRFGIPLVVCPSVFRAARQTRR